MKLTRMKRLRVAYDARLPTARWGGLLHVLRVEQPELQFEWCPLGFPTPGRPLLHDADVGLLVEPPRREGLSALTLETSPMVVAVAVGHRLARRSELCLADVLDEPFPGVVDPDPQWTAFWTLDEQRGGPARFTDDAVTDADEGLQVVVSGRAIAALPASLAAGLPHPGVVALPLVDGPQVATHLVWRANDDRPAVRSFVELAEAMTSGRAQAY